MSTIAAAPKATHLAHLDWDRNHFGFPVGRIAGEATDEELSAALVEARIGRYRLVYWATAQDREPPPRLLAEFDGRHVDRKLTFARTLPLHDQAELRSSGVTIAPLDGSAASAELFGLAVAAGAYSRFAVDPGIPSGKFAELYRIWIERSVRCEIADAVLVARGCVPVCDPIGPSHDETVDAPLAGMITVKVTHNVGNIGLVAVAETHRGRGVGRQLIDAAHRWMAERNATRSTVVTQAANVPACRLYQRAGYAIQKAENYYHFWP